MMFCSLFLTILIHPLSIWCVKQRWIPKWNPFRLQHIDWQAIPKLWMLWSTQQETEKKLRWCSNCVQDSMTVSYTHLDVYKRQHSHFAFYGWITNAIYVLIAYYFRKVNPEINLKKYEALIVVNLLASFAMLGTFMYGSYFWGSILASAIALLCSFVFFFFFIQDLSLIHI